MTATTNIAVTGMTCGHCVAAVTEALRALGGVQDVKVDLASGAVTVRSERSLDVALVAEAVRDAGFEVAGSQ